MTPVARSTKHLWGRRAKTPRPQARSLRELADEFGVTWHKLMHQIRLDPAAPKAEFRSSGNTWYVAKEVRDWWAARTQK